MKKIKLLNLFTYSLIISFIMSLCTFCNIGFAATKTTHDIGNGNVQLNSSCASGCEHVITGTSDSNLIWNEHKIIVDGGNHTIVLKDVTINTKVSAQSAMDIKNGANVTLVLEGENNLVGNRSHPAIWVETGSSLTIEGNGTLTATAVNGTVGMGSAGIGSGYGSNTDFGNIVINSGNVISKGTAGGAGIGGGYQVGSGKCNGSVTINGGFVKAYGDYVIGSAGAGIGAGENADYSGSVTITGGVVFAQSGKSDMPSIGGGGSIVGDKEHGTFSTGANGNAVIVAPNGIGANSNSAEWNGVFASYNSDENTAKVSGNTVILNDSDANIQVWGNPVLDYNLQIESNTTLSIKENDRNHQIATLTMLKENTLKNNGVINIGMNPDEHIDSSALILYGGKEKTSGNGKLYVGPNGRVKVPLTEDLVKVNGADDLTYNGREHKPEVNVKLENLWGYNQNFYEGTDKDYSRRDENNINAGTAHIILTSTGKGNLLEGNVDKEYTIKKADFNVGLPSSWTVQEGEDSLLSKLPKPNISIDPLINDDMSGLKAGNVEWYTDEQRTEKVTDDYVKDMKAGEEVIIYGRFSHNDSNFVSPKEGSLKIVISKYRVPNVNIYEGSNIVTFLSKIYGDASVDLDAKINFGQNDIEPSSAVAWESSNENVASVDENGNVTFTGAGNAVITATVESYDSGQADTSYAQVKGRVAVVVKPKEIKVDESTVKVEDREYDGTKNVHVEASLENGSIINNDDAQLVTKGYMDDELVGENKNVSIEYSLEGKKANNYTLTPKYGNATVNISKATPGEDTLTAKNTSLEIFNNEKKDYYVSLESLIPDDKEVEDGILSVERPVEFNVVSVSKNEYFDENDISIVGSGKWLKISVDKVNSQIESEVATIEISLDSANFKQMRGKVIVSSKNPREFVINASADKNGKVNPDGEIKVLEGSNQSINIKANNGYVIDSIIVDGKKINVTGIDEYEYIFKNIDSDHTISVSFKKAETPINPGDNNDNNGDNDNQLSKDNPDTSDGNNLNMYIMIAMFSLIALCTTYFISKKKINIK